MDVYCKIDELRDVKFSVVQIADRSWKRCSLRKSYRRANETRMAAKIKIGAPRKV